MPRNVELVVEVATRANTKGLTATGTAAKTMQSDVEAAARKSSTALDRVGASADDLDGKAGRATGALGALSSGFELVGAEKYAGALQAAALATDFASGAGQAMTLLLELESVQRLRATAATVAQKTATIATTAATKAAAAGQWLLNAALTANPVGLVVLAVVALVAALVLAYKKSETFRTIVQHAFAVATFGVRTLIAGVSALVGWVVDKAGPAWKVLKDAAVAVFDKIRTTISDTIERAKDKFESFKTTVKAIFDALLSPIQKVRDAVDNVIDAITDIDLPDVPGFGFRASSGSGLRPIPAAAGAGTTAVTVNVSGVVSDDPAGLARTLTTLIADQLTRTGRQVVEA